MKLTTCAYNNSRPCFENWAVEETYENARYMNGLIWQFDTKKS